MLSICTNRCVSLVSSGKSSRCHSLFSGLWHKASKVITADVFPTNMQLYSAHLGHVSGTVGEWKVFNDADYGGNSHGTFTDMEEDRTIANHNICDTQEIQHQQHLKDNGVMPPSTESPSILNHSHVNFTRFKGQVNISDDIKEENQVVGGFVAFKANVQGPAIDLRDYQGLEVVVRTNRPLQSFMLNMGTYTLIEDDMYQLKVQLKNDENHGHGNHKNDNNGQWKTLQIPFPMFRLTARGITRETQRANDSLRLESIGFLFRDKFDDDDDDNNNDGEFQLDIHSIVAVPDGITFM